MTEPLQLLEVMTITTTFALLLVLVSRTWLRKRLGPACAYALWVLVPISMIAPLIPMPSIVPVALPATLHMSAPSRGLESLVHAVPIFAPNLLLQIWCAGALLTLGLLLWSQMRFSRTLNTVAGRDGMDYSQNVVDTPLVIGVFHPRIVLPADFSSRFTPRQQAMILAHERMHIERGHMLVNVLVLLVRCLFWFNPLVAYANSRFRFDQELACDAEVVLSFPASWRASYAKAILQAHLVPRAALRLSWNSTHPVKERILSIKHVTTSRTIRAFRVVVVAVFGLSAAYVCWASQPHRRAAAPTGVEFSSEYAKKTGDGGWDLAGNVVLTITGAAVAIEARSLSSQAVQGGQELTADGEVHLTYSGTVITTSHARITVLDKIKRSTLRMDSAHIVNPAY
jgi:beta-lactamase regulating signal transducer with metallopeptidase domain